MLGNVFLFGEVNSGFDQRNRLDDPLAPGLRAGAQHAFEMLERLPALRFRLSRHQIGEAFDRGQIHAAVLERAAREFAGLRVTKLIEPAQRGKNRCDYGTAAMHLQLGEVLAGLAVRRRKPERQAFVDDFAAGGIAHAHERGPARFRHTAREHLQCDTRLRA